MCPDQEILSLYIDGELPSPWKEKMDAHLASCKKCKSHLLQYRKLRVVLEGDRFEVSAELKKRVWDKVLSRIPGIPEGQNYLPQTKRKMPAKARRVFWNRTVSLPFPAAVAAACVIITFLVIQGLGSPGTQAAGQQSEKVPPIAAGISADVQGIIPVSDMDSVLQYLSAEDMADFVIMRLPETRNFSSFGEPTLLKATDYSRRSSPR
jgi:negative regulator of sigma E activity